MARSIPSGRFDALLHAAAEQFIAHGFALTQMEGVAKTLGVAKGTLYGYVESKQALFHFVVQHCALPGPVPVPEVLPIPSPEPGATLRLLEDRMRGGALFPTLAAALVAPKPDDPAAELDAIANEIFERMHTMRVAIKLLERCGRDDAALHELWHPMGRYALLEQLQTYIKARVAQGVFREVASAQLTARFFLECMSTWAVHIHWDSAPENIDLNEMRNTVLRFLSHGLLAKAGPSEAS